MSLKQSFSENKIIGGVITALILMLVSWGIWTTNATFSNAQELALICQKDQVVGEKLDQAKKDMEEIKKEAKVQSEKINDNQKKMYELLLDIQKQIKQQGR